MIRLFFVSRSVQHDHEDEEAPIPYNEFDALCETPIPEVPNFKQSGQAEIAAEFSTEPLPIVIQNTQQRSLQRTCSESHGSSRDRRGSILKDSRYFTQSLQLPSQKNSLLATAGSRLGRTAVSFGRQWQGPQDEVRTV